LVVKPLGDKREGQLFTSRGRATGFAGAQAQALQAA
jgi:hypothetical protein